ncbi:unnamed protein product, partial [Durusdinium trenchii]
DSDLTSDSLANIIVADDGYGDGIHIPSVLISKEDGRKLLAAVRQPQVQVVVELAWDLPTDHVVTMDMWMSSASIESNKFLKATEAVSNLFRALLAKDLGKSGVLPKQHSPFDC